MSGTELLKVEGLKKDFYRGRGFRQRTRTVLHAVDGVDLDLVSGETLGLVGESGSGKTTLGRCILRLVEPTAGRILWEGVDLLTLSSRRMRRLRREMQIIFQDPFGSLNPRMTAGTIVAEPLIIHHLVPRRQRQERVDQLLEMVGLDPSLKNRYPHEFSGGQRQRIGIARALAVSPRLVIADEPVSALDVSVQAQILNLLVDLQERLGLTYLFIAHDLSVVRHIADRVAVMYLGRIVELAPAKDLYGHPLHPYTQAILSAIPVPDPSRRSARMVLPGELPAPFPRPRGCSFSSRCPLVEDRCREESPQLEEHGRGHLAACHLVEEG